MYLATAGERLRLHGTDDYKRSLEYKPRFDEKKGIALDLSWSSDGKYFGAVCNGWPKVEVMKFDDDYEDISLYRCLNVDNPTSIAFSKLGEGLLAVGNDEGIVSSFDCKSKEDPIIKFPSCTNKVTSLDFSSSDSAVAAGTTNGEVYICGIKSGKLLDKRELRWREAITSVKFHHSRKGIMAAGCNNGSVTIWDINIGVVEKQFLCHESPCKGIVFSPNNITFMASIGYDFVLNFFDIKSKSIICKASIPEAGSSLDIHCDGTTLAVGTIRGAVYIYDARMLSSPKEHFSSLNGCINKLAFQPSAVVRKRRSRGPQTSLKKLIFKPVDVQLENTDSSTSSCDSLFSPISGMQEPQNKSFKDDIENSFTCGSDVSPREKENDDSVFTFSPSEIPSSTEKFGFLRPLFSVSESTFPSERMNSISHLENNEATPIEYFSSGLGTLDIRSKISERSLKVSQAENMPEDHNKIDYLGVSNIMKCPDISPVRFAPPKEDLRKNLRSSIVKTPITPRLLDVPSLSVRKMGDVCGDTIDKGSEKHNLLSFLEPLNFTQDETQNDEVSSAMPNSPSKAEKSSLKFLLDSASLNLMESKREEAESGVNFEDLSDREVHDILNKYCISKRCEDVSNASPSFEESEMKDVKETVPLSIHSDVKVFNKTQGEEEEEKDAPKLSLEMKQYLDEMKRDMCYEIKKALSTMHIFNVSAHAKQEILLYKLLSELRKEKVDKCIGTDGSF